MTQDVSENTGAIIPAAPARTLFYKRVDGTTLISIVLFVGLIAAWEMAARAEIIPRFLAPSPSNLVSQVIRDIQTPSIWRDVYTTTMEIVSGFAIGAFLGIGLGAAIALNSAFERIIWPYVVTLQTIPKIAVAPILIIWFGFGVTSKIVIVGLICFFPILVNAVAGFKNTDIRQIQLMKIMDASAWQTFYKVRFPSAIPYLIASFKIAIVVAVIGAVVGEFLGASVGLGSLIVRRQSEMHVDGVFSALVMLSALGLLLNYLVRLLSRKFAFWVEDNTTFNG